MENQDVRYIPIPPQEVFNHADLIIKREQFLAQAKAAEEEYKKLDPMIRNASDFALRRQLANTSDPSVVGIIKLALNLRSVIESYTLSAHLCTRIMHKRDVAYTESGDLKSDIPMDMKIEENLTEMSAAPEMVVAGRSRNARQGQDENLDVGNFFERPVEIYTSALPIGSPINLQLYVWDLYTLLPAVRAKLRNYAFFRANMHVKVSIAGTPYHYGRVLVSYQVRPDDNTNLTYLSLAASAGNDGRKMLLNYLSQAQGSVIMNVNENVPVEVFCPYVSPQPMARLFNQSPAVIGTSTKYDDIDPMGSLFIRSINTPAAINATSTPLYLQVYAWLSDVELGTTTGTQIAITTESGKMDERETGPVEKMATRVFQISSNLTKVPYLYPYAKASEIASGAVRNIAAIFGWSMPVLNQHTTLVRNNPYCNGALTIGSNTSQRVVLDPQQELAVDSTIVGVSEDDMIISNIASRMTYLTTFTWADTATGMTTPIWTCENSPNLVSYHNNGVNVHSQPTAMAFAALPFTYWRGSIKYRFEVVCSAFHRGRLAVFFEPNVAQRVLINSEISLNKQYIAVVDIQETNTFEVTVGWASSKPWLRVGSAQSAYLHTDQTTIAAEGLVNGYIGVIPFTSLQSPDSSDISVNVYVCCEDLQVNGLTGANLFSSRVAYTESASLIETESGCLTNDEVLAIDLNRSSATTDGLCEDYFGEQPLSFRSLLKRFIGSQSNNPANDATSAPRVMKIVSQIFPPNQLQYGASSGVLDLFTYLRYAYVGLRGSIRVRVRSMHATAVYPLEWIKVGLEPPSSTYTNSASFTAVRATNFAALEGDITFAPATNSGIEVEFPYYSNNLFACSFGPTTDNFADVSDGTFFRNFHYNMDMWGGSTTNWVYDIERAAGEDFTFLRYNGAPFYTTPVVA